MTMEENEADKRKTEIQKDKAKNNRSHIQIYDIITSKDPSWQSIIYELINTEQLDPWNIDLGLLCAAYFEKIRELEENNFFISSKIILAAALLLRIKSEILINKHIKEIDEILFGKEQEKEKYVLEKIELDENDLPLITPKSPMPRFKKVTLDELMSALDNAIKTESRRINKEIEKKQRERLALIDIPKFKKVNIRDRIRQLYAKILSGFNNPKHKLKIKLPYSHFTNNNEEEKIACFLPLLHLSNSNRVWLEQVNHFDEIWIYMYEIFKKNFPDHDKELIELEEELKEEIQEIAEGLDNEHQKRVEKINKDFENPLGDLI